MAIQKLRFLLKPTSKTFKYNLTGLKEARYRHGIVLDLLFIDIFVFDKHDVQPCFALKK